MAASASGDAAAGFDPLRPKLTRLAYRMLGSVADAEDVVQDAFLRWLDADRDAVRVPEAFLRRVVTRLCLDQLKSARRARETYVGPWLPAPVIDPEEALADDITLPLMLALERLSPLERAAFLLHDVFGESFDSVAEVLGREPSACRQLASRAREHVRAERRRYPVDREHGMALAEAFFAASREGDTGRLGALLAEDVSLYADGGGKRPAVARVMRGADEVARTLAAIARLTRGHRGTLLNYAWVNGLPGYVTREADGVLQTTALLIEGGRVRAVYVMRNPDKLRHLEQALH